ncbi:hypothetical protein C5S29_02110 [ANME-1 cluster archaeon GoMg3.2]|nr:hypothetical protein [ANME-1 cluster archaeon GoMg3.2]
MIIKEVGISPSTTYNTAYTLRAYALAHGTLLPSVATSYMLGTLAALKKLFMPQLTSTLGTRAIPGRFIQ